MQSVCSPGTVGRPSTELPVVIFPLPPLHRGVRGATQARTRVRAQCGGNSNPPAHLRAALTTAYCCGTPRPAPPAASPHAQAQWAQGQTPRAPHVVRNPAAQSLRGRGARPRAARPGPPATHGRSPACTATAPAPRQPRSRRQQRRFARPVAAAGHMGVRVAGGSSFSSRVFARGLLPPPPPPPPPGSLSPLDLCSSETFTMERFFR